MHSCTRTRQPGRQLAAAAHSTYAALVGGVVEPLRLELVVDARLAEVEQQTIDLALHLANLLVLHRALLPQRVRLLRRLLMTSQSSETTALIICVQIIQRVYKSNKFVEAHIKYM